MDHDEADDYIAIHGYYRFPSSVYLSRPESEAERHIYVIIPRSLPLLLHTLSSFILPYPCYFYVQ